MGLPGRSAMRDPVAVLRVESDAIRRAQLVHTEVELAMGQVRAMLRDLLAGAPEWAADGELLPAVRSLVEIAAEAALRSQTDAVCLGDALLVADRGYQAVEAAAVAERRSR